MRRALGEPAHLPGMTLSISSPDELVAAIPHLLGFKPQESIVFLPMGSELPVARVDLPTTARDRDVVWRSISDAYGRYALSLASVMGPPCCHEHGTTWTCYRAWRASFRGSTVTRPRCR